MDTTIEDIHEESSATSASRDQYYPGQYEIIRTQTAGTAQGDEYRLHERDGYEPVRLDGNYEPTYAESASSYYLHVAHKESSYEN